MAKRFGRNQRRRLRESIEAANAEAQRWQDAYYLNVPMLEQQLAKARRELDYIKDAAAGLVETRLLPAKVLKRTQWPRRWDATPSTWACDARGPDDAPIPERGDADLIDLYAVGAAIGADPAKACQVVHFFCEGAGPLQGDWRYMISDQALLSCGLSPDARRRFMRHITEHLFDAVDRHYRRRR